MIPAGRPDPRATRRVLASWALLALLAAAAALPRMDELGLYYDEAFLAQQARDFVMPGREHQHAASVRSIELFGRPFPVRNAAYLGSLKSQLLIPVFLLFDADADVLRTATFATACVAMLLSMLFVARFLPVGVAGATGLLIAADPSFFFFGLFEWGPFTTNFLCRAGGLWLLALAWQTSRAPMRILAAGCGGLALGLGVFSRADFALIVGALGLGVLIGHPRIVVQTLRERRSAVASATVGLLVGSAPMWLSAASLLGAGGAVAERGDLGFRAGVLWSVLDGSQFHRLMQTGGLFEAARDVDAPAGLFGLALLGALGLVGFDLLAGHRRDPTQAQHDPRRFLWITTIVVTVAMLALPGAVRAHHQLNLLPFAQIIVACAAEVMWRRAATGGARTRRILAVAALSLIVIADLRVIAATTAEIESAGGRGRWTRETHLLAAELEEEPGSSAVSLDWGFHEPLLFLTHDVALEEAIWAIPRAFAAGQPWSHAGDGATRYLVHDEPYDLFGLGPLMLDFARAQRAASVSVEAYRDRTGEVAFYTIRFLRPHRLSYSGRFEIE